MKGRIARKLTEQDFASARATAKAKESLRGETGGKVYHIYLSSELNKRFRVAAKLFAAASEKPVSDGAFIRHALETYLEMEEESRAKLNLVERLVVKGVNT